MWQWHHRSKHGIKHHKRMTKHGFSQSIRRPCVPFFFGCSPRSILVMRMTNFLTSRDATDSTKSCSTPSKPAVSISHSSSDRSQRCFSSSAHGCRPADGKAVEHVPDGYLRSSFRLSTSSSVDRRRSGMPLRVDSPAHLSKRCEA